MFVSLILQQQEFARLEKESGELKQAKDKLRAEYEELKRAKATADQQREQLQKTLSDLEAMHRDAAARAQQQQEALALDADAHLQRTYALEKVSSLKA